MLNDPIRPLTDAQSRYISSIKGKDITFATGPAGNGQNVGLRRPSLPTHCVRSASRRSSSRRPAVEARESLGFLPGRDTRKAQVPSPRPLLSEWRQVVGELVLHLAGQKAQALTGPPLRGA